MRDIGQHDVRQAPQPCDEAGVFEGIILERPLQSLQPRHRRFGAMGDAGKIALHADAVKCRAHGGHGGGECGNNFGEADTATETHRHLHELRADPRNAGDHGSAE